MLPEVTEHEALETLADPVAVYFTPFGSLSRPAGAVAALASGKAATRRNTKAKKRIKRFPCNRSIIIDDRKKQVKKTRFVKNLAGSLAA